MEITTAIKYTGAVGYFQGPVTDTLDQTLDPITEHPDGRVTFALRNDEWTYTATLRRSAGAPWLGDWTCQQTGQRGEWSARCFHDGARRFWFGEWFEDGAHSVLLIESTAQATRVGWFDGRSHDQLEYATEHAVLRNDRDLIVAFEYEGERYEARLVAGSPGEPWSGSWTLGRGADRGPCRGRVYRGDGQDLFVAAEWQQDGHTSTFLVDLAFEKWIVGAPSAPAAEPTHAAAASVAEVREAELPAASMAQAASEAPASEPINHEARAARAWPVLVARAREGRTITYKELGDAVGVHYRAVTFLLQPIDEYCRGEHLPPLTILVVQGDAGGRPGGGFDAWDVDDFDEGVRRVCAFDWAALADPFAYALLRGETQQDLARALIARPGES